MGTSNYSNNIFKYAGKKYLFAAELYVLGEDGNAAGNYLNNESIVLFEYTNELNELYLKANMTIVDKYAVVDKYLDRQFAFCKVTNSELDNNTDGDLQTEKPSKTKKLEHDFLVTGIQIVDRQGTQVTYTISMVSLNWKNCISNINYTNYGKKPEEIFDIVKAVLKQASLQIIDETFDKIKSGVKINYITNENDNVFTALKYLFNKMYYYDDKAESMKFIIYNETAQKYQLFDLAKSDINNGTTNIVMSMFKSQIELQINSQQVQLGGIQKLTKKELFQNIFDRKISDYNIEENIFVDKSIERSELIKYKNEVNDDVKSSYVSKYANFKSDLVFQQSGSYWNSELSFYDDCIQLSKNDGTLVVGVDPDMLRKPGSAILLSLDRDDTTVDGTESTEKLDETKEKYKQFEGLWYVSKVRHLISPSKPMYRQNLSLFRNFNYK